MTTTTSNHILVKLSDDALILNDPSQDIRGRKVIDRNGEPIGHISDLFVDETEQKLRMLEVAAGGFLGLGERHFLVPIDAVTSVSESVVHVDQTRERIIGSPAYDPKLVEEPFGDVWAGYYGHYGYSPYWNPGYIYPMHRGIY